jgi:hypothetical protein
MGDTGTPHVSHISHSCAGPAHQPDRVAANRTSLVRALLFAPPLRALPSPLACLSSPDLPLICLLRRDEEEEIRVGAGGWKDGAGRQLNRNGRAALARVVMRNAKEQAPV